MRNKVNKDNVSAPDILSLGLRCHGQDGDMSWRWLSCSSQSPCYSQGYSKHSALSYRGRWILEVSVLCIGCWERLILELSNLFSFSLCVSIKIERKKRRGNKQNMKRMSPLFKCSSLTCCTDLGMFPKLSELLFPLL